MSKKAIVGLSAGLVLLVAFLIALNIGAVVLAVFMLIWNITDIQNVGANFWNVTWIVVAALMLLGVVSRFFNRSKT